jgi:hypothetical protein
MEKLGRPELDITLAHLLWLEEKGVACPTYTEIIHLCLAVGLSKKGGRNDLYKTEPSG